MKSATYVCPHMEKKYGYFKRDISWLSFNYRVLLEAADATLPIYERIRFLSIYASNLEEFYEIRVADQRCQRLTVSRPRPVSRPYRVLRPGTLRPVPVPVPPSGDLRPSASWRRRERAWWYPGRWPRGRGRWWPSSGVQDDAGLCCVTCLHAAGQACGWRQPRLCVPCEGTAWCAAAGRAGGEAGGEVPSGW